MKAKINRINRIVYESWCSSLLLFVFGILLIAIPDIINSIIGYLLGCIICMSGIFSIMSYVKNQLKTFFSKYQLIYGIITLVVGVFIILNPLSVSSLIIIFLGIWMIVNGITKLNASIVFKNNKEEIWSIIMVISILTIICGALLVFNPFKSTMVVTQIIGIFIIIYSILDIMQWLLIKRRSKQIVKFIK